MTLCPLPKRWAAAEQLWYQAPLFVAQGSQEGDVLVRGDMAAWANHGATTNRENLHTLWQHVRRLTAKKNNNYDPDIHDLKQLGMES